MTNRLEFHCPECGNVAILYLVPMGKDKESEVSGVCNKHMKPVEMKRVENIVVKEDRDE